MLEETRPTAMRAAFGRIGIRPEDVELNIALALYRNHGGTFERGLAQLKAAFADMELSGKGQEPRAGDGQASTAQPRQAVEDEVGHHDAASNGPFPSAPSSSPNRGGEGHASAASNGHQSAAPPVREPSTDDRAAAQRVAAASARTALSILDRMKTSAGKPWGDVCAHELDGMYRDGVMAKAVKDWIGPLADSRKFEPIRKLMNAKQFELVLMRVRGQNHDA